MSDTTTTPAPSTPARSGPSRGRRIGAWILIVLASILAFGVGADVWAKQQLLSTPRWVKMSDEILAQPKVQAALADYLVDQIYTNVDVKGALADQLPEDFKGIAGPLSGALRGPATTGVEKVLGSSQVQKIWAQVNTAAHKTLVNVLEDKMPYGSSANGKVVLDLGEIVKKVADQMGLPDAIVNRIPADVGQITIFQSDQLALVQRSVAIVRIIGPVLVVVVLLMYALAVWLNRGRRIRTLRNIGWSVIIVGVVLILLRRLLGNYVVSMIPTSQFSPIGDLVWAIVTKMIRNIGLILVSWGALVVLGMLFIGPSRPARAIRRVLAPAINTDPRVFWAGCGVLYLLVLWISPGPALQIWWSVLLIAALGAFYLEVLRRRSLVEFPEAGIHFDGFEERAAALWGGASSWARGLATRSAIRRAERGGGPDDHVDRLDRLSALHQAGALTDEEFTAAKAKLLG